MCRDFSGAAYDNDCATDLAADQPNHRSDSHHRVMRGRMAMLEIRATHTSHVAIGWDCDSRQHFVTFEGSREQVFEEFVRLDVAVSVWAGDRERRIQCGDECWVICCWVSISKAASDRAAITHLLISNEHGGFNQDRTGSFKFL